MLHKLLRNINQILCVSFLTAKPGHKGEKKDVAMVIVCLKPASVKHPETIFIVKDAL